MRVVDRRTVVATLGAFASIPPALAISDPIELRELYGEDMSFSDAALQKEGDVVSVQGYMAPPLRAETNFFVLTKIPMAVCPFCESAAEWPDDILAIYAKRRVRVLPFNVAIRVIGELELGVYTDPELGFVSRVRLTNAEYEPI